MQIPLTSVFFWCLHPLHALKTAWMVSPCHEKHAHLYKLCLVVDLYFLSENSIHSMYQNIVKIVMAWIILFFFSPCNDKQCCEFDPSGCGCLLVLNQEAYYVDMILWLLMMVATSSSVTPSTRMSTMKIVFFLVHEYATRENGCILDGTTICIINVLKLMKRTIG